MRKFGTLVALVLLIALSLSLASCGPKCQSHMDIDGDGLCESCNKEVDTTLSLIEGGYASFAIVLGDDTSNATKIAVKNFQRLLEEYDVYVDVIEESDPEEYEIEVLVGTVASRGEEYTVDKYALGKEGYTVRIIGNKIVVAAGDDELLAETFQYFVEDILGIDDDADYIDTATMNSKDGVLEIYSDYPITSLKIGENDARGYSITADFSDPDLYRAALELQNELYSKAGYFLPFVRPEEASEKSVVIRNAPKDSTPEDSFRVYEEGGTLYIECEYHNFFEAKISTFVVNYVMKAEGDVTFLGRVYSEDVSFVTYEMFGANGRDEKNDFEAIYAAHEFANISGQTVLGTPGSTYYVIETKIGTNAQAAKIKTNVDWRGAKFVIVDTDLCEKDKVKMHNVDIFVVAPDRESESLAADKLEILKQMAKEGKLGPSTTRLELGLGYAAMIKITNSAHKVYVRYGSNANSGSSQSELVIVDAEGNIDATTALLLDYEAVSSATVIRIDDSPLTVKNGTFTTYASRVDTTPASGSSYTSYFARGINVQRSNTTVSDVIHYIEGEFSVAEEEAGLTGPAYSGFFYASNATDVLFKDCTMTAHRHYLSGSYDFGARFVNNIRLEGCNQTNFYLPGTTTVSSVDRVYWGIGGTNFCKNMTYDRCMLTRFDAHQGLYNGKITNSTIGEINLIGGGDMLIENTTVVDNNLFMLRQDYGATWHGTITVRDVVIDYASASKYCLVYFLWTNHNFGYTCHFPNIILDNLSFKHGNSEAILSSTTPPSGTYGTNQGTFKTHQYMHVEGSDTPECTNGNLTNINPYIPPEFIIVVNNLSGVSFYIPENEFFSSVKLRGWIYGESGTDVGAEYDPTVDDEYPDYVKK